MYKMLTNSNNIQFRAHYIHLLHIRFLQHLTKRNTAINTVILNHITTRAYYLNTDVQAALPSMNQGW